MPVRTAATTVLPTGLLLSAITIPRPAAVHTTAPAAVIEVPEGVMVVEAGVVIVAEEAEEAEVTVDNSLNFKTHPNYICPDELFIKRILHRDVPLS